MTVVPPVPPVPDLRDPLAFLPRQDRHKPKCGPVRPSTVSRKRAYVLIAVHVLVGLHIWHWYATGKTMTPLEPSESMETIEVGRINAGFVLFVTLIAGTLVFGRFFCGWACHLVAVQDLCSWLLGKLGIHPRPVRSRLLVFGPWVVAGHMFAWPVVKHWLWPEEKPLPAIADWELQLQTTELWRTFPGPIMSIATFVIAGGLIVWWLGAKGFCTHGCPYGAFFAVADRLAPVRIKVTDACNACGHCTQVCSSNVRVHEEVARHGKIVDPGCMKCLDCVSVCPKDALYVGIAAPKPFAISQQRITARADFTWSEELLLAGVAVGTTQWVWRGAWFGEHVAFLLSVALGVLTAVFTLLTWRLVRRAQVTFQNTALKQGGRFTRAGRWGLLVLVGWLGFTAHTGYVEHLRRQVHDRTLVGMPVWESFKGAPVDAKALENALAVLDRYLGAGLVVEPIAREMRGLALRGLRRHLDAEAQLLACLEGRTALFFAEANLALASYMMDPRRQRFAEARRLVAHVLASSPDHPVAQLLQQQLDSLPK